MNDRTKDKCVRCANGDSRTSDGFHALGTGRFARCADLPPYEKPECTVSSKERGDQFRVVQSPSPLSPCMFCGSPAELSQRQRGESDIWDSAVSCSNADGVDRDECPLFYPPESFYHETKREAVAYWNKWAQQRAAHETKPARDADHCDYPDCEQHWKGLLFDCVQGWLKGDNVVGPMQIAMRALGLPEKATGGTP